MLVDLNASLVFVEIVNAGSFAAAAKLLNLPKSTVSDRLAQLEANLGTTLLTRTTRSLKLTEAGSEYFKRCQPLLTELTKAFDDTAKQKLIPSGTLRISCPMEFAAREVAQAIAEYRSKFPAVRVEVSTDNLPVQFPTDRFDLAIRGGHLKDSTLRALKVGSGTMIVVASPKYLSGAPDIRTPQDLKNHNAVSFSDAMRDSFEIIWKLQKDSGQTATIRPQIIAATNSFNTATEIVLAHQGIGFIPEIFVRGYIAKKELVRVLPTWSSGTTPMNIVYPWQRVRSKNVDEMLPILKKALAKLFS